LTVSTPNKKDAQSVFLFCRQGLSEHRLMMAQNLCQLDGGPDRLKPSETFKDLQ
jgi:hypothetical protein